MGGEDLSITDDPGAPVDVATGDPIVQLLAGFIQ
ncbi:MAG: hypothetical protein QOF97_2864, partial [Acidimicrobiaceae bacterium]